MLGWCRRQDAKTQKVFEIGSGEVWNARMTWICRFRMTFHSTYDCAGSPHKATYQREFNRNKCDTKELKCRGARRHTLRGNLISVIIQLFSI
jgi:hypothetical protein